MHSLFWWGSLLTCLTPSPLYEEHRRLLQALRSVTDPLQFADVPIGHPITAAHRVAAFTHADAVFPSPPNGSGVAHSSGNGALQTLSTHRVPKLTHPAARLSLSGCAHQTAVTVIHHLPCWTVLRHCRTHGLITLTRTSADHIAFTEARIGLQRCYKDTDAEQSYPNHIYQR